MRYPAIVYKRESVKKQHANNAPYTGFKRYKVTFITDNPDSEVTDKLDMLPKCYTDRSYVADNLYHHTFLLYF